MTDHKEDHCNRCGEGKAPDEIKLKLICNVCESEACEFCGNYCSCGMILCDTCFKAHKLVCDKK